MEALLTSIGLVALAEFGDKTQLLALLLAARLQRPWPIIAGIAVATVANHALAGAVGIFLDDFFPEHVFGWLIGIAFIAFGLWTLIPDKLDNAPKLRQSSAFMTTLIAFFFVEMGDKTQLATIALAAKFDALIAVVAGTTLGMLIANAPVVWLGEKLTSLIPLKWMRIMAAIAFVITGVATIWRA